MMGFLSWWSVESVEPWPNSEYCGYTYQWLVRATWKPWLCAEESVRLCAVSRDTLAFGAAPFSIRRVDNGQRVTSNTIQRAVRKALRDEIAREESAKFRRELGVVGDCK